MIFLTGGTGFLGSYILFRLLQHGEKVIALRRPTSTFTQVKTTFEYLGKNEGWSAGKWEKLLEEVTWVEGDLLDYFSLTEGLGNSEKVIHAGAMVTYDPGYKELMLETNISGTENLVNAALEKGVREFHYVSSVAALDRVSNEVAGEERLGVKRKFDTVYSQSKYRAEMEVWRGYGEGLNGVIINPGVILGAAEISGGTGKIFTTVQNGLGFYPSGATGFVDVRDVVEAFFKLMNDPGFFGKRYVLSAETVNYKSLLKWIASCLDVPPPKIRMGKYPSLAFSSVLKIASLLTGKKPFITPQIARMSSKKLYFNNKRVVETLDFQFKPVADSVKEVCRWMKEYQK